MVCAFSFLCRVRICRCFIHPPRAEKKWWETIANEINCDLPFDSVRSHFFSFSFVYDTWIYCRNSCSLVGEGKTTTTTKSHSIQSVCVSVNCVVSVLIQKLDLLILFKRSTAIHQKKFPVSWKRRESELIPKFRPFFFILVALKAKESIERMSGDICVVLFPSSFFYCDCCRI